MTGTSSIWVASVSRQCIFPAIHEATADFASTAACSFSPTSTSPGFGPYYGDVWSDLEQFEESLRRVRDVEADWYVTFHQKGVIEGRETFLAMLDKFHSVIDRRHVEMLEFLTEPRSLADMAQHRFVYRPHVDIPFAGTVERRTAELHVARMLDRGEAVEVEPGRFQTVSTG